MYWTYLNVTLNKQAVGELVESARSTLAIEVSLVLKKNIRTAENTHTSTAIKSKKLTNIRLNITVPVRFIYAGLEITILSREPNCIF